MFTELKVAFFMYMYVHVYIGHQGSNLFTCLLNAAQPLPLSDMAQEVASKLKDVKNFMYRSYLNSILTKL